MNQNIAKAALRFLVLLGFGILIGGSFILGSPNYLPPGKEFHLFSYFFQVIPVGIGAILTLLGSIVIAGWLFDVDLLGKTAEDARAAAYVVCAFLLAVAWLVSNIYPGP